MSYQRDRAEFTAILAQDLPDLCAHEIAALSERFTQLANRSMRYAALACNRELSTRELARAKRTDEAIRTLAASVGCVAVLSNDPRGAVVKLTMPSGRTNDWGQEGICVPTREY